VDHDSTNRLVPPSERQSAPPKKLGRWGNLFLSSLRKNDPQQLQELQAAGELEKVAQDVDQTASQQYRDTLNALLEKEKPAKKGKNRQAQVARLERQAEEIVREAVLVPSPEWARQSREGYTDENTATWSEEPLLPKPSPSPALEKPPIPKSS